MNTMRPSEEVIPDSEDDDFDILGLQCDRALTPLSELAAPISSPKSSSSYVLPSSVPTKSNVTSRISQYTTDTTTPKAISTISQHTVDTVPNTIPYHPSDISAFPTSTPPPETVSKKVKPRPKPNYAGAMPTSDSGNCLRDTLSSTPSSSSIVLTCEPSVHSGSKEIFTMDISERIKARRRRSRVGPKPSGEQADKVDRGKVKKIAENGPASMIEDVIEISSDNDVSSELSRARSSSRLSRKRTSQQDPIDLHEPECYMEGETLHITPDPSSARRRMNVRDSARFSDRSAVLQASRTALNTEGLVDAINQQYNVPPPRKTKKTKINDNGEDGIPISQKCKKRKSKNINREPKAPRATPKRNEKDVIRSRELISDSDDELAIGNEDMNAVGSTSITNTSVAPPFTEPPCDAQFLSEGQISTGQDLNNGEYPVNKRSKKCTNKKRKARVATHNDGLPEVVEGHPPLKNAGDDKGNAQYDSKQETCRETTPLMSRRSPSDMVGPVLGSEAISSVDEVVPSPKKKRRTRMVIEDDKEDEDENTDPLPKSMTTTPAKPNNQRYHSIILSPFAHPPKNRSLSAVLRVLNGSSPRVRVSPSVSRSLLTRIAPLHPNRRTPPPPPPRIIPKKTKKEIEREEKWEEELQDSVEGWCELEEGERNRLRKAKRDWELGFCEE